MVTVRFRFRARVTISLVLWLASGAGPLTPECRTGESRVPALKELGLLLTGLACACDC